MRKRKDIKDGNEVIRLYTIEKMNISNIAIKLDVNRKKISMFLKYNNVKKINHPLTDEHKKKLSGPNKKKSIWRIGTKSSLLSKYKNMANHLRFDVDYLWLTQFEDFEKLKFLNRAISGDYYKLNNQTYKEYLIRFYNDDKFEKNL